MTSPTPTSDPPAKDNTVDIYTTIGKNYQDAFDNVPAQNRSLQWLIDTLPPRSTIIDIGCGTGKPAVSTLAEAGHLTTGLDITPKMIEVARAQVTHPNASFLVADSRTWKPDGDGSLDAVTVYFSFLAGVSQSDIRAFFPNAYRWLRPGGLLVYATVPDGSDNARIRWMGQDATVSSLTAEETFAGLKGAGFEVVRHETELFMPKGQEAGLCRQEEVQEEKHLFVYCRKPA